MAVRQGAQLKGYARAVDPALSDRARRFVSQVGIVRACALLRASSDTIEALCSPFGRLRPKVVDRIRTELEREELELARKAS